MLLQAQAGAPEPGTLRKPTGPAPPSSPPQPVGSLAAGHCALASWQRERVRNRDAV